MIKINLGGDTEDEIEVRVEELDEIESGQREYEEALARVDLAKKELDDFIVEQEYGVQENNDGNDGQIATGCKNGWKQENVSSN